MKPDRNEANGRCGTRAATINAEMAMLHHGKNKQAQKLSNAMRRVLTENFILVFYDLILRKECFVLIILNATMPA